MTNLVNGKPQDFVYGDYIYIVEIASGVASLELTVNGLNGFVEIPESTVTTSTAVQLTLPTNCTVRAIITDPGTNVVLKKRML